MKNTLAFLIKQQSMEVQVNCLHGTTSTKRLGLSCQRMNRNRLDKYGTDYGGEASVASAKIITFS